MPPVPIVEIELSLPQVERLRPLLDNWQTNAIVGAIHRHDYEPDMALETIGTLTVRFASVPRERIPAVSAAIHGKRTSGR